ncbi:DUF861 domain-containing protein [Ideonella sp. TBM-1]|uniref:DUF861 domain-containing protein n=2 Tax=Ideonella livida TaxID=2707176 RepID=A0A7C9TMH8_9BURK|nr:DUF861 domain-containing protein [Ideonella livida]
MSRILRFDPPDTLPERDQPRLERREVGAPVRQTWTLYEPAGEGLCAGIWTCEPGRWRIVFGPHEHEYFMVLEGRVRLHDAQGGVTEAGPGQALVIPAGFEGSFEVLERVRKHFVVVRR